jgi:hypothetical protein
MMLTSRYQMWIAWGPALTFLYSGAYRSTLCIKHPSNLVQSAAQVWREIWGEVGPLIDEVMRTGEATYNEGMFLLLERSGFPEETYEAFFYSPLFDDDRRIAGMFCVLVEESVRVISECRLATLRNLALATVTASTVTEEELFAAIGEQLGENPRDVPFSLIYLLDTDARTASLAATRGFSTGEPAAPCAGLIDEGFWLAPQQIDSPAPRVVADQSAFLQATLSGARERPPHIALVVPIVLQGRVRNVAGFLVTGINPHRYLDRDYRGFLDLLAGQIGAALANVRT